jgi:hypothetical protein
MCGHWFEMAKTCPSRFARRMDLPKTWARLIWPSFRSLSFMHGTSLVGLTFVPLENIMLCFGR